MRVLVGIIAVLCVFVVACGSSDGTVFADLAWSVRCADGSPDCSIGTTCLGTAGRRSILRLDGDDACPDDEDNLDPLRALCELRPGDGRVSMRLVGSVSNDGEEQYGIEVTGLVVDPETDEIVEPGRCKVAVFEDGARYDVGSCGEQDPSSGQPCQISGLNIEQDDPDISLRLKCENLRASTGIGIDVTGISSSQATVRFNNCTGW